MTLLYAVGLTSALPFRIEAPLEDTSARVELLKIVQTCDKVECEKAFTVFFQVIFTKVKEHVSTMVKRLKGGEGKKLSYTELASHWRKYLEDEDAKNRKDIFQATSDVHRKVECSKSYFSYN